MQNKSLPKATVTDVLREYARIAGKYWLFMLIAFVSTVIPVISGGIIAPIYYKKFFDILAKNVPISVAMPQLVQLILFVFAMNMIAWVFLRIYSFTVVYIQTGIMNHLRQDAYEYILGHSYAFFSNTFSGSLVQKINRFMRSFERVMDRFFQEIVPIMVRVIGVCIVLWYAQPVLTYAIIVWMIVFFVIAFIFARWKIPYDIASAEVESRASAALADSLSNHATIQMFNRFSHEAQIFSVANTLHTKALAKKWNVANATEAIQAFINVCTEFIIFYVAIKYWGMGMISVGTFILLQMYVFGLMYNFWSWGRILRDIYEAFADAKETVEIMKLSHGIQDAADATDLKVTAGAIDVNNIGFHFNEGVSVLNGINLHITPGERVAFVGPSGAGKSTIVRLLMRLYDIQEGSISIDGQDIKKVTQGSLREAISFVPQDPILFHRSLKDNIKYGRTDATDEEVIRAAKLAHCHEFISALPLGYDTFVGERGIKLSGGERQRVAIARAILKNAPILILDEATSSLDSHSEMLIQDALDILMKDKTVVVIAHRLSTISKMNRIVVIDHGSILEQGSHDELVAKNGLYAKLWSLQSHGFIK
ncbi:MAG: ABC transporter ATP-binding protein [Candidatus Taylorbacteria bacterium]